MRLTARDAKNAGMCIAGQKWFCEVHGLDFRRFLKEGIEVADIAHIDDDNLRRAIAVAQTREGSDGRG